MIVRPAGIQDIEVVREIAWKTWPAAYSDILSEEQIDYMLNKMYSHEALAKQFNDLNFRVLIAGTARPVGFCVAEFFHPEPRFCRIHKLYVLPDIQGTGAGKALIDATRNLAAESGMKALHLNVNRYNPSVSFYERNGFSISYEEDIDIGEGFLMEDYVMIREIS